MAGRGTLGWVTSQMVNLRPLFARGWQVVSRFWRELAVAVGIISGLFTVLAYLETRDSSGPTQPVNTAGFETTLVHSDAVQLGNAPGWIYGVDYAYAGPDHDFTFNCDDADPNQMAILTYEVFDIRSPRHMALNGVMLPPEPAVLNAGLGTWDTVVIVIDNGILTSSDNMLHVAALDSQGLTDGNLDDFLIRNLAILYKTR